MRTYAFRTDSLDEAIEFVGRNFAPHSRVVRSAGPLDFRLAVAVGLRVASGKTSQAVSSTLRTRPPVVAIHLPAAHGAEYRIGRRVLRSAPDAAVLLCPGHDYTVETAVGETAAALLDPALLTDEIDALRIRRPGTWTLRSTVLPLPGVHARTFREMIKRHGAAVARAHRGTTPDAVRAIEARLASWLAARVVGASGLAELSPASRQAVERVEAWIRDHVLQLMSLEDLRAVAGLSTRTLQEACLARWGQTPMELVLSQRLETARSFLASGTADTVTEAAVRGGFTHLGRFSILYRRAFGEPPSRTLAAARSRARSRTSAVIDP